MQAIKDEILGTGESDDEEGDGEEGDEDESGSEEEEQEQQKMQIQVRQPPMFLCCPHVVVAVIMYRHCSVLPAIQRVATQHSDQLDVSTMC